MQNKNNSGSNLMANTDDIIQKMQGSIPDKSTRP